MLQKVHAALAAKDATGLAALTQNFPQASREGLQALLQLYGDVKVLDIIGDLALIGKPS